MLSLLFLKSIIRFYSFHSISENFLSLASYIHSSLDFRPMQYKQCNYPSLVISAALISFNAKEISYRSDLSIEISCHLITSLLLSLLLIEFLPTLKMPLLIQQFPTRWVSHFCRQTFMHIFSYYSRLISFSHLHSVKLDHQLV